MPRIIEIYKFLKTIAPEEMKMEHDNVGFLVGSSDSDVAKILVSLDITNDVITEALDTGAELIVSHHPLFKTLNSVTDMDLTGKKIVRLISGGVSAICMHTNLDAARGGVNDTLARAAGIAGENREAEFLFEEGFLESGEAFSYGRVGYLEHPCSMPEYLDKLKISLNANGLRYHDSGRKVHKIAVVGGSGGIDFHKAVKKGCDTFITADIKYSLFLEAKETGINLIDGGHFCTENPVMSIVAEKLQKAFPGTDVITSERDNQTVMFY